MTYASPGPPAQECRGATAFGFAAVPVPAVAAGSRCAASVTQSALLLTLLMLVVVVSVPHCHRPIAPLSVAPDGRVQVGGSTHAENGDPGGTVTQHIGPRHRWASRVYSADVDVPEVRRPRSAAGPSSVTDVGTGSRGPSPRRRSRQGYQKAVAAGRKRIGLYEL